MLTSFPFLDVVLQAEAYLSYQDMPRQRQDQYSSLGLVDFCKFDDFPSYIRYIRYILLLLYKERCAFLSDVIPSQAPSRLYFTHLGR